MIDNNIIQSLGVGSGIDTNNLVNQLVEVERAAPQGRIDSKRELAQTRISDFGLLSSALSTLQDAAEGLTDPEALFSKSASFTDSNSIVPVELSTDVQPGSYSFNVSQIASAQTLAFAGLTDPTDTVGEGTLTFNFGNWARDIDGNIDTGAATPFTQNTEQEAVTITVDSTNNTLEGLRDTINNAEMGASASIIYDGTSYRLSVVADSGAQNELEITATEDPGSPGQLSRFAFNTAVTDFGDLEAQAGNNAILTLNGIAIERPTNSITDIVEGLTLDVLQVMEEGESTTITVTEDKAFAEQNVRTFVEAYNLFLEAIEPAIGIADVENEDGEIEKQQGALANDALAKSMLSQIRNLIASGIPGLSSDDSNFTSLTNLGIRTELDGTLSISESEFTDAFANNFSDIQKLLAPNLSTSSDDIFINSTNNNTDAGQYDVVVSQNPTRGVYNGGAFSGISFPLDTSAKTYTFEVDVNGTSSAELTLPTATYNSEAELASAIQSLINNDLTISTSGVAVTVAYNAASTGLDITSTSFGTRSNVSINTSSADSANDLGFAVASGTSGLAAAGTINGVEAFGSSNVLLPALGEPGEGLALVIGENATTATVNFSRGFAGELDRLVSSLLDSQGPIATRTETLNDNIDSFDAEQERLDRRISAYEERLMNQFIAMERILSSLNTSGTFLDNLIDTLPFTSQDN